MIQSILVYSLLMVVMLFFAVYSAKRNIPYLTSTGLLVKSSFWRFDTIFPLLVFAVIFGMRYDVGVDHLGYLDGYLWKEHVGKNDLLFDLLSDIGWKLNLHFVVYFSILAFIQVFFFFYAFKDERYIFPFLVFFLFTNGEWGFWMNGIRQALAMCIWIFTLKYIKEKKIWKYLLWGIVAFLFHKSAIILLIFYPILRSGKDYFKSISFQLILIVAAFVFQMLFSGIIIMFEPVIAYYMNFLGGDLYRSYDMERLMSSYREGTGTGLVYLFRIALNVLIVLFSKKLKLYYDSKRYNILYFFFIIGLITSYMFPEGYISFTRPFRYFYIFQSIMYAFFLYYLYKTKPKYSPKGKIHALMYYGLIFIFIGVFYLSHITSNENASLWYQFFFEKDIYGYPN